MSGRPKLVVKWGPEVYRITRRNYLRFLRDCIEERQGDFERDYGAVCIAFINSTVQLGDHPSWAEDELEQMESM